MMGIPFRVDGRGRILISWMSRHKAYWSISDEGGTHFAPRITTPDGGKQDAAYPLALANHRGEVLFLWLHEKRLHWARYTLDGKFTGEQGEAGTIPSGNKPTAFVGGDDHFYLVF
jgi:hypothetical protein